MKYSNMSRLGSLGSSSAYDPNVFSLSDCAVCSEGFGRGVGNGCHSCDTTETWVLLWTGIVASAGILLPLVIVAVVFLIGGLGAVDIVCKSLTRNVLVSKKASKVWSVSQKSANERHHRNAGARNDFVNDIIAPELDMTWGKQQYAINCDTGHCSEESPQTSVGSNDAGTATVRPFSTVVGTGTGVVLSPSDVPARHAGGVSMPARHQARHNYVAGTAVDGVLENKRRGRGINDEGKATNCSLGVNIKRWASRVPLRKLKILLVVWQILTVFSSITGVEFPASYALFLSWINVVNFDIGHIVSVSCILLSVNFYGRLLVTTLTPLVVAAGLVLTYHVAKRRAGVGSAGVIARRAAWSRHVAAGLLLTFLVRFGSLRLKRLKT